MKWIWVSILVLIAGLVWDTLWHSFHGMHDVAIPPAHWLQFVGLVLGVGGSVRLKVVGRVVHSWITNGLILTAGAAFIGAIWDNFYDHIHGVAIENSPAHFLLRGGLLLFLIFSIVAFINERKYKKSNL